jgi:MOSC domain-containing protein YiiM
LSDEMKTMKSTMPQTGTVCWIGLRPYRRGPIEVVEQATADVETGLIGDRFNGPPGAARQVTLIQQEHLQAVASILARDNVDPSLVRRNIVVAGINLLALKDQRFRIGEAILETTGNCQPCSLMESQLGPGGYNAMRGHGGITATVIQGGLIRVGDCVSLLPDFAKKVS